MKKAFIILLFLTFALSITASTPIYKTTPPKLFFYENLTGTWGNNDVEIKALVSMGGKITALSEKLMAQNTVTKTQHKYKWTITASGVTGAVLSQIDAIYFDILTRGRANSIYSEYETPFGNVSKYPLKFNKTIIAKTFLEDGVIVDFQDLIQAGFTLTKVNNTRWKITGLKTIGNSLILDPELAVEYCQELSEAANSYILTEDLYGDTCLIVSAADIAIDCDNHYIYYGIDSPGYGIWVTSSGDFTTIENCNIYDMGFGTDGILDEGRATTVRTSTIWTNTGSSAGINANAVNYSNYHHNNIYPAGISSPAITVFSSLNITISDNTLYAGMLGMDGGLNIYMNKVNASTISNNSLLNEGIRASSILHGIYAAYSYNSTIAGNYFYYQINADQYRGIETQFCSNVNFTNNYLTLYSDNGQGALFENTSLNAGNNTIYLRGTNSYGMELKKTNANVNGFNGFFSRSSYQFFVYSSSNLNASFLNLYTSGGGYSGAYIQVTNYNLTDSIIRYMGGGEAGFETNFLSGNNYIRNLTVITNSTSQAAAYFLRVVNLNIYDSNFTSLQTLRPALKIEDGGNTENLTFINSFLSGFTNDTVLSTSGTKYTNLTFVNVTFNLSKVWWKVGGVANLSVYYPISVKVVSNLGGALDNATTNLTNGVNALVFQNVKTNSAGETPWTTYLIYKRNGTNYFNNLNWFYASANRTRYSTNFTNQSISNGTSFIIVTLIRTSAIESFNNAYFLMSSMLEPIIVIGIIVFLFAFLYYATPKENQAFKTLFLMLSVFTVLVLLWLGLISTSSSVAIQRYDEGNTYMGMDIVNTTNTEAKNTIMGFTEVYVYIPWILLMLLMVIFIYNAFIVEYLNQKRERNEGDI